MIIKIISFSFHISSEIYITFIVIYFSEIMNNISHEIKKKNTVKNIGLEIQRIFLTQFRISSADKACHAVECRSLFYDF